MKYTNDLFLKGVIVYLLNMNFPIFVGTILQLKKYMDINVQCMPYFLKHLSILMHKVLETKKAGCDVTAVPDSLGIFFR